MVRLVKNRDNKVPVKVTSFLNYGGFSATLEVEGLTKTVANLKSANASITFTAAEIDGFGEYVLGHLTVFDKKGDEFVKMLIQIQVVETEEEALGFQAFRMALVSFKAFTFSGGGGGGGGDVVRHSDFANVNTALPSIISCQDTVNNVVGILKGE